MTMQERLLSGEQAPIPGVSAETYFPDWTKIRHVADFLESTSGFADMDLPQDRGWPVYFCG